MEQSEIRFAGFWVRTAAHVIDAILLLVILMAIVWWMYAGELRELGTVQITPLAHVGFNLGPVIAILLFWEFRSATPGKMMLGLRIADAETLERPSTMQLIVRFFAYLVSMVPLFIGFLWVAFDPRKQGWHDKIARTLVVHRHA